MKKFLSVAGALMMVAAFIPGNSSAQQLGETMDTAAKNITTDMFTCGVTTDCTLHVRLYGEVDPSDLNGSGGGVVDGFPSYGAARSRYSGDSQVTANYAKAGLLTKICEPWYAVWDGVVNPGDPLYISYYGTQSQLINRNEGGLNINNDVCGDNTGALACFAALGNNTVGANPTGSSQGPLDSVGGVSPVPVPTVLVNGAQSNVATLSLVAVHQGNNLNLPSKTANPCEDAAGTPLFFDDVTATEAPSAVYAVGLYVYSNPAGADLRTLNDLEGTTSANDLLTNPSSGMACTNSDVGGDCPAVGFIPCGSLGGATCLGDLLAPGGGSFDVGSPVVDAALGTPLGTTNVAVFVTKVFYRGSVAGSEANPGNNDPARFNPSLVSLFSAGSTRVSYTALAARVSFTRINASGNRVVIQFETVGGGYAEFTIQRADDGVSFVDLGTVAGTGETDYSFTDTIRGRRPTSTTYRIIAEDFNGTLTQIFKTVDLKVEPSRGRSRR